MRYDFKEKVRSDTHYLPYSVQFFDYFTHELNSNCYLGEVSRYEGISGSDITKTLINFLTKLNVNKIFLTDSTKVVCKDSNIKMDLSLFKEKFTKYQNKIKSLKIIYYKISK